MGVGVALGPGVSSTKASTEQKWCLFWKRIGVTWHYRGLARTPRVFDPGVLTQKRSRTSVGGGVEMADLLQVKSLTKREIKE